MAAAKSSFNKGFVIAVVGGKGGLGKSVFSANFAMAMAMDTRMSPALLDLDPQASGDQSLILGVKQVKGFGDKVVNGQIRDSSELKKFMNRLPAGKQSSLYTLQMFQNPESLLSQDTEKVELALKLFRKTFPVTIIDCGSRLEGAVLTALDMATMILVVANPDILVLNQTKRIIHELQSHLFPPDMVKVVLNRYPQGSPYTPQFLEKSLKRQVYAVIPEDTRTATQALSQGQSFVLSNPQSALSKQFFGLSRLLVERRVLEKLAQLQRSERPKLSPKDMGDSNVIPSLGKSTESLDPRNSLKLRIHSQLVSKMDLKKEDLNNEQSREKKLELRQKARAIVSEIINHEDHPWKSREQIKQLTKEVLDEAFGLGPLEELLADPEVTEIMVNRSNKIYIERAGRAIKSKTTFTSNVQLMSVIERIVAPIGRRIDQKTPYCDARLMDGSRVHAIIPPLSIDGPMLTIRKFPSKRLGPSDLVKFKSITPEISDFLRACIEAKLNVIISGGTGSGKTTLLNVLSNFIPSNERILTVEDAAELQLGQEHVGRLETRPPSIEGSGAVTIRDLVRQTLRMRPDRIIVGEVRGGEALDMLQAMNTGHDGSMATVHSNNPREAISRLETLVMMAGMELPAKAIREQITSAVDLVVQQSRLQDGSRKVTHITEVLGLQGDVVTTQDIFLFRQDGLDKDRRVVGKHVATGFIPKFMERIESLGIKIPRGLFKAA